MLHTKLISGWIATDNRFRGVYYTGGSVNPARTFGPCVVLGSFDSYHWIYWVGPFLGSLLATGFYLLVKALEYETVNPEQDTDGGMKYSFDPHMDEEKRYMSGAHSGMSGTRTRSSTDPLRHDSVLHHGGGDNGRPSTADNVYKQSDTLEAGKHSSPT